MKSTALRATVQAQALHAGSVAMLRAADFFRIQIKFECRAEGGRAALLYPSSANLALVFRDAMIIRSLKAAAAPPSAARNLTASGC